MFNVISHKYSVAFALEKASFDKFRREICQIWNLSNKSAHLGDVCSQKPTCMLHPNHGRDAPTTGTATGFVRLKLACQYLYPIPTYTLGYCTEPVTDICKEAL